MYVYIYKMFKNFFNLKETFSTEGGDPNINYCDLTPYGKKSITLNTCWGNSAYNLCPNFLEAYEYIQKSFTDGDKKYINNGEDARDAYKQFEKDLEDGKVECQIPKFVVNESMNSCNIADFHRNDTKRCFGLSAQQICSEKDGELNTKAYDYMQSFTDEDGNYLNNGKDAKEAYLKLKQDLKKTGKCIIPEITTQAPKPTQAQTKQTPAPVRKTASEQQKPAKSDNSEESKNSDDSKKNRNTIIIVVVVIIILALVGVAIYKYTKSRNSTTNNTGLTQTPTDIRTSYQSPENK